jgi:hypothetical protein
LPEESTVPSGAGVSEMRSVPSSTVAAVVENSATLPSHE